ncbi:hypothetical protein ABPG72_000746 [Tetrahymena utriculariae]
MNSPNNKVQNFSKYIKIDEEYIKNHSDIFNKYGQLLINIDEILIILKNNKNVKALQFFRILESQNLLIPFLEDLQSQIQAEKEEKFQLFYNKCILLFNQFKSVIKFISRNVEDSFRTDQIIPQENVQEVEKNLIKTQKELLSIINELFCSSKVNNQSYQQINEEELNEMERDLYQKKKNG